jgi:hypothetical protein
LKVGLLVDIYYCLAYENLSMHDNNKIAKFNFKMLRALSTLFTRSRMDAKRMLPKSVGARDSIIQSRYLLFCSIERMGIFFLTSLQKIVGLRQVRLLGFNLN